MEVVDAIGALVVLAGGAAIGVFLTSAYHERIRNQHRAYEIDMAEHRDQYAALAQRRRLQPASSREEDEEPIW
ncbi:MAG TPA: hypothetical protein VGG35_14985 [Streptosporangiaceae bacterium]|jgi:hypothetical protein